MTCTEVTQRTEVQNIATCPTLGNQAADAMSAGKFWSTSVARPRGGYLKTSSRVGAPVLGLVPCSVELLPSFGLTRLPLPVRWLVP